MCAIEHSDAVNAGMAIQTEGHGLAPLRKSPPSDLSLVGWLVGWLVWILRISLTVVRLALCKGVVILNQFGVRCSGLETVRGVYSLGLSFGTLKNASRPDLSHAVGDVNSSSENQICI